MTTTNDQVPATDTSPNNGIPDYVEQALAVFNNDVWGDEVTTMGYRAPKSDFSVQQQRLVRAPTDGHKFDVYLANLGDDQLYGYCTSDDPHFDLGSNYQFFDGSAYCVVDNNYTEAIFQNHSPLENLQVTAAHEFFHAVQFAYDAFEDQWLLEATATWMEDEIYDDIDDNLQYLVDGPLRKPLIPLDKGATNADPCCHVYGDWIFFRFLSEHFGPAERRGSDDREADLEEGRRSSRSGLTTSRSRRSRTSRPTSAGPASGHSSRTSAGGTASRGSSTTKDRPTRTPSRRFQRRP